MARNFTVSYSATDFMPATGVIAGAALSAKTGSASYRTLYAFDDSTQEYIVGQPIIWPDEYTGSGTLKANIFFSAAGSTGTAAWSVNLEAITPNADSLNITTADSFGNAVSGTKALSGTTAGDLLTCSITITSTSNDSVASGDGVRLAINRATAGADDASGDCFVYAVELYEET